MSHEKSREPLGERARRQDEKWLRYVEQLRLGNPPSFDEQWGEFQRMYHNRPESDGPPRAWQPTAEVAERSNLGRMIRDLGFSGYDELFHWSTRERGAFWQETIRRLGVVFEQPPEHILDYRDVRDPRWLIGARLNSVESCFRADPDKIAIVHGHEGTHELGHMTYRELGQLVDRFAAGFRAASFEDEAAIALYMPMTVECVAAYLGIIRAGGRVVSIPDSFSPTEVRRRLEISDAAGVVTVDRFVRGGRSIDLYAKVKEAGAPRAIVIPHEPGEPPAVREGDQLWNSFLRDGEGFEPTIDGPDRVINVLFSSGTTGSPKAIPWTHLTPIKAAMDGYFHQDIRPADVVAWPTNIGWMMGPWLIFASFVNGATMALYEGLPTGEGFTRFVRDSGVSVLGLVPSLVRAWRAAGSLFFDEWPGVGGGYISGTVVQPASPSTFTTPTLGLDLTILDEQGQPAAEGEMGEIFLVPPSIGLSQRLLNRDHHEVYYAGAPEGPDGQVLRRHGDQMARLHRGFFSAQGRADDNMNLGGIEVSSLELEQVLDQHPAVYESAAVAVQPAGEGAEQLVVYAVPRRKTGAEVDSDQLATELGKLIKSELNPLFKIFDLKLAESLPRTASNKLMRRKLRAQWSQPD
jgi:acetyl-CoA synthetase